MKTNHLFFYIQSRVHIYSHVIQRDVSKNKSLKLANII